MYLNATGLNTWKRLRWYILCYVYFTTIKKWLDIKLKYGNTVVQSRDKDGSWNGVREIWTERSGLISRILGVQLTRIYWWWILIKCKGESGGKLCPRFLAWKTGVESDDTGWDRKPRGDIDLAGAGGEKKWVHLQIHGFSVACNEPKGNCLARSWEYRS